MRYRSFLLVGHLLVLTVVLQIYVFLDSRETPTLKDIVLLLAVPVWLVAAFRSWLLAPATSIFGEMIPRISETLCSSRRAAFRFGCLVGLLDLIVMVTMGAPLYLLYRCLPIEEPSVFWAFLFSITFFVSSLMVTLTIAVHLGRKQTLKTKDSA